MNRFLILLGIVVLAVSAMAMPAFSQITTTLWTGTSTTGVDNFNDQNNWSNDYDTWMVINTDQTGNYPQITSTPVYLSLDMHWNPFFPPLSLRIGSTFNDTAPATGYLIQHGGDVELQDDLLVGEGSVPGTSQYDLEGGSLHAAMCYGDNSVIGEGGANGVFNIKNNVTATFDAYLFVGHTLGDGTMNVTATAAGAPTVDARMLQIGNSGNMGYTKGEVTLTGWTNGTTTRVARVNVHEEGFYVGGWASAEGYLKMKANSQLDSDTFADFGNDGGTATITLEGNAVMNVFNTVYCGHSATGEIDMYGTSKINVTNNEDNDEAGVFAVAWGGGHGTLKMTGSSHVTANSMTRFGRDPGSYCEIFMDTSATLETTQKAVIFGSWQGQAAVTMTGGSKVISAAALSIGREQNCVATAWMGLAGGSDTASMTAQGQCDIGCQDGGQGSLYMYAHTVLDVCKDGSSWVNIGQSGTGYVELNDFAKFTAGNEISIGADGTGVGEIYVGDGDPAHNAVLTALKLRVGSGEGAQGTLDLNAGGTIVTSQIYTDSTPAQAIVNFDGGTLKPTGDEPAFVSNSGGAVDFKLNVLAGGVIVDTDGHNVGITEQLLSAVPSWQTDGGLKKLGRGTLTLTVTPRYNGDTTVDKGTLDMTGLTLDTPNAVVTVAEDAVLNVGSIRASSLVIGGPPVVATAVPEPGTLVLLALAGMGALLAWRWK